MLPHPSAAALNHLLAQNGWALARLARFAGKTAHFDIAPFSFACTILADGTLRSADASTTADATLVIPLTLLPRLALYDEHAQADIHTEGDAALLTEIFFLSHNLRWDAAHDLGRITGNSAAERITQTLQGARQRLHGVSENLSMSATTYFTEEHPLLASRQQIAAFVQQVDTLRDDVARMEQRIRQLAAAKDH